MSRELTSHECQHQQEKNNHSNKTVATASSALLIT